MVQVVAQSAVSGITDLEKWLDRCRNFVVDTSGERHAHIYARQAMLASEVPQEWWDSHYALDKCARIIKLELQDHILPRVEALDLQLADILRCLGEAFGKLHLAMRNVLSDRSESEHGMAKARLNALLGVEDGYIDLPCPLCDDRFTSKQELKDHFDNNHPSPSPNDQMLISVGIHDINVGRAVEPLRELIRQANHRIASLNALEQKSDALLASIDDLKLGQRAIYQRISSIDQHISEANRNSLKLILDATQQNRLEQGEMQSILDAIRRTLRYILEAGPPLDDELHSIIVDSAKKVESKLGLQQKLELTMPIIPLFLEYKIELPVSNEIDLQALWNDLKSRFEHLDRDGH